jgi:hypothetical protein
MTVIKKKFFEHLSSNLRTPQSYDAIYSANTAFNSTTLPTRRRQLIRTTGKGSTCTQSVLTMDFGHYAGPIAPERGDEILKVTYSVVPDNTVPSPLTVRFALGELDGIWNANPSVSQAWTPYTSIQNPLKFDLKNTDPTTIASNASGTDPNYLRFSRIESGIRGGHCDRIGQVVTIPEAPGTLGTIDFDIRRIANPVGNCWVTVFDVTADDGSDDRPIGGILATSDLVDVSTTPTSGAPATIFTFSGADQLDLSPFANTRLCFALEADYLISGNNYIRIQSGGSYADGTPQIFGTIAEGNVGNMSYCKIVDFPLLKQTTTGTGDDFNNHSPSQLVTFPPFTEDVRTSLTLSTDIFQEWVNDSRYPFEGMDKLMLMFAPGTDVSDFGTFIWGRDPATAINGDILEVTWRSKNRVFIT